MLVLTRKRSERIHIGDNVVVEVIRLNRGSVKIGIKAPRHVRVLRAELCDDTPPAPRLDPADLAGADPQDGDPQEAVSTCSDQFPVIT